MLPDPQPTSMMHGPNVGDSNVSRSDFLKAALGHCQGRRVPPASAVNVDEAVWTRSGNAKI